MSLDSDAGEALMQNLNSSSSRKKSPIYDYIAARESSFATRSGFSGWWTPS